MMTGKLQREETPIDQTIVNELIELTPEWWHAVELEVVYGVDRDVERYAHRISSLEGHREPIRPSEKLLAATNDLGLLFRRHGKHWKRAKYEVMRQDDGTWSYTVSFEYS